MKHISVRQCVGTSLLIGILFIIAFFVQLRLFLFLIVFLAIIIFYRGLEFNDIKEIEFYYKED